MTDGRTLTGAIEHWVRAAGTPTPRARGLAVLPAATELPVGSDLPPLETYNNVRWDRRGPDEALAGSQG